MKIQISRQAICVFLFFSLLQCAGGEKAFVYISSQSKGQLNSNEPWRFSPEFLLDGKASTGFCADGKAAEPSFTFRFGNSFQFKAVEIINGLAKSYAIASQNSQVKRLKLTVLEEKIVDGVSKVQSEDTVTLEFKPVSFAENVPTRESLALEKSFRGNTINVQILDSHKGSKFNEICLSEIRWGEITQAGFMPYPIQNEEDIRRRILNFEEGSKHFFAFRKMMGASESGTVQFYDKSVAFSVFFKPDETFSFGETFGTSPDEPSQPAIQGKYTILTSAKEGVELSLNYFDTSGVERSDTWIFKRANSGDEDYETFKTKLGTSFSDVFDPKTKYLLFLKSQNTTYLGDRTFYNYEIPLK